MNTIIKPDLPNNSHSFNDISQHLLSTGYLVLPSVFEHGFLQQLHSRLLTEDPSHFYRAGIGRQQDYHENRFVRSDEIMWLDSSTPWLATYFQWVEELRCHLNRELFLGLQDYECHFAHYAPGNFYKRHLDAFKENNKRKITVILYLNPGWCASWGGELLIYDSEGSEVIARVQPEFGTLVVFLSEEFPHEVLPASHDRYSLTGWLRQT